jgi:hypothetical protein
MSKVAFSRDEANHFLQAVSVLRRIYNSPIPGTKMYIAVGESRANLANFISETLACSSASTRACAAS